MANDSGGTVSERLWNRNFVSLWLICFSVSLSMNLFNSILALYIDSLGGRAAFSGAMSVVFSVFAVVFRMISGSLSDLRGRRVVMVAGGLIFTLATFLFNLTNFFPFLLMLRMLQGCGFAAVNTAATAAVADTLPQGRMGEGIGYVGLAYSLTTALGPLLGLWILNWGGFRVAFMTMCGFLVLATLLGYFGKEGRQLEPKVERSPEGKQKHKIVSVIAGLFEKRALLPAAIQFFSGAAQASVMTFAILYAEKSGFTTAGIYFTVAAAMMFLCRLVSGRIFDRCGPLYIIAPAQALGVLAMFVLAYQDGGERLFLFSAVLYGLFTGMHAPALNSLSVMRAPVNRRGAAIATYYAGYDLGIGVGSLLWGRIIDVMGFSAAYRGAGILLALTLAGALLTLKKGIK